jgi:hypothetical protein
MFTRRCLLPVYVEKKFLVFSMGFSGGFSATHQRRSIYGHSQNSLRSIVYCTNNQIDLWCDVEVLN